MPKQVDVFFGGSPVFELLPNAQHQHTSAVAWYSGDHSLDSGWAWGQQYLEARTAVVDAGVSG